MKIDLALRRLRYKYRPDQPRVPAGHRDGGRWTDASSTSDVPHILLTPYPGDTLSDDLGWLSNDDTLPDNAELTEGELPAFLASAFSNGPDNPLPGLPNIPPNRPPTQPGRALVRRLILTEGLRHGYQAIQSLIQNSWLKEEAASYLAYFDSPKTLAELQETAASSRPGYDKHHIVEQTSARDQGYLQSRIDRADNLVSIPRFKHYEINGWYAKPNYDYNMVSPREYLQFKDWDERERVGLEALRIHGVLKP